MDNDGRYCRFTFGVFMKKTNSKAERKKSEIQSIEEQRRQSKKYKQLKEIHSELKECLRSELDTPTVRRRKAKAEKSTSRRRERSDERVRQCSDENMRPTRRRRRRRYTTSESYLSTNCSPQNKRTNNYDSNSCDNTVADTSTHEAVSKLAESRMIDLRENKALVKMNNRNEQTHVMNTCVIPKREKDLLNRINKHPNMIFGYLVKEAVKTANSKKSYSPSQSKLEENVVLRVYEDEKPFRTELHKKTLSRSRSRAQKDYSMKGNYTDFMLRYSINPKKPLIPRTSSYCNIAPRVHIKSSMRSESSEFLENASLEKIENDESTRLVGVTVQLRNILKRKFPDLLERGSGKDKTKKLPMFQDVFKGMKNRVNPLKRDDPGMTRWAKGEPMSPVPSGI